MKKIITILFLCISLYGYAQKLPSVILKDLDGNTINTADLVKDGKPIVIDFWATWCKPCIIELNTVNDLLDDWTDETGIRFIAVSIDDTRSLPRVAPYVNGRDWQMDILLDTNSDFKRAMNVNNIPHTFLINGQGKIVWQHVGFAPSDEEELYDQILKLTNAKSLSK